MAQRRMFSKKITDTDHFLEMPLSTQALYFHLNMGADDEGFIDRARTIQRTIGASNDDMKILISKGFLIPFESGVVVIRHWRIHNYIQSDRFQTTIYQDEKSQLEYDQSKVANFDTEKKCIQNVSNPEPQVRLGKDRLDKDRLTTYSADSDESHDEPIPYQEIVEHLNNTCGKGYTHTGKSTRKLIRARWNDGFRLDDFKKVIDTKSRDWLKNKDMNKYLRPETLFGTKFETYLNEGPRSIRSSSNDIGV